MLKILLCLVIVSSSAFLGNFYALKFINRRKTLSAILYALNKSKSLISFARFDVFRLAEGAFCSADFPLLDSKCFQDETLPFESSFRNAVENMSRKFSLKQGDKELLIDFAKALGETDVEGQIAHINLYEELFSQRLSLAKEKEQSCVKLCRVMGFTCGLGITLMLI